MKVKIGPINYLIEKKTAQQLKRIRGEEDFVGLANHKDSKILLLEGMAPEFSNLILMHEIVHGLASVYGVDSLQADENGVHSLAVGICNLLQDNPWLVRKFLVKK